MVHRKAAFALLFLTLFSIISACLDISIIYESAFLAVVVKSVLSVFILLVGHVSLFSLACQHFGRSLCTPFKHKRPLLKFQLVILWIFGIGAIAGDVVFVYLTIECLDVSHVYGLDILYRTLKIVFVVFQMIFLTLYDHDFRGEMAVYGLLVSNLLLWVRITTSDLHTYFSETLSTNQTNTSHCIFNENSSEQIHRTSFLSFLVPTDMEFFTLTVRLYLCTKKDSLGCSNTTPTSTISGTENSRHNNSSWRTLLVIIVSILPNSVVFIAEFLSMFLNFPVLLTIIELDHSINSTVVLLMFLHGFWHWRNTRLSMKLYLGDYLYIISMISTVTYSMIGILSYVEGKSNNIVTLIKSILFLMAEFYQTLYVLHLQSDTCFARNKTFQNSLIFIGSYNVTLWMLDVFVALRWRYNTGVTEGHEEILDRKLWIILNETIICPLSIYFRFHSFITCFGQLWTLQKNTND